MSYLTVIMGLVIALLAVCWFTKSYECKAMKDDRDKFAHMVEDLRDDCDNFNCTVMDMDTELTKARRESLEYKEEVVLLTGALAECMEDREFYRNVFNRIFSSNNEYVVMRYQHKANGKINGCKRVTSKDFLN